MRALTYITTLSLVVATAVNVTAILATKAETRIAKPAIAWIQFSLSAHNNSVQHITTAYYVGLTIEAAMSACNLERQEIIDGMQQEKLVPIIEPACTIQKPWSWVDVP